MKQLLVVFLFLVVQDLPVIAQDYEKGLSAARAKEFATAINEWQPLAEGGHAEAQFNLGTLHEAGLGTAKNMREAAKWYSRAAGNGHTKAQYNLGLMYLEGRGVVSDGVHAIRWLRKAAQQEHGKAQYTLGVIYQSGRGVPKDLEKARVWFDRAKTNGIPIPNTAASAPGKTKPASGKTGSVSQSQPRAGRTAAKQQTRVPTNYRIEVSDDPNKRPFSVPLSKIESRINHDPFADGIILDISIRSEVMRVDIQQMPGDTSIVAAIRVIWMIGRLAEDNYREMRFSDVGEDIFTIKGESIRKIGAQFIWGEKDKGQNPIYLMRVFVDALRRPDGSRVAPRMTGSLLGDTGIAAGTINKIFHPEWTFRTIEIL